MSKWLALLRAERSEKNPEMPEDQPLKTLKTPAAEVLRVLRVPQSGVFEKIPGPAEAGSKGFEGFEGSQKGAFSENFSAPLPALEPVTRPEVVEAGSPEAAVARRLDAMAAENEARRDWHAKPVEGWREGRLTIRRITTGDETTINLRR